MISGIVDFYNVEQRFGYIKPKGETKTIRVLSNALERAGITMLSKGQKVKFDTHTDTVSGKLTVRHIEVD